mmetsp:Transcript_2502/g.5116  ORF Transcript_2502/g.5116 Transcript_2502/m.5116 type:complete len:188 (+) Transcript_2502:122-685(+)
MIYKENKTSENNDAPIRSADQKDDSSYSIGEGLIEDWPRSKGKIKQVRFSESANLRIYPKDENYTKNMSYSSKERKEFNRNAIMEALRLRKVLFTPTEGFHEQQLENGFHLLESHGVEREEIVGIEHLVFELSPHAIMKTRQMHAHSILLEQEKHIIIGLRDEDSLALASEYTSTRSLYQATIRART